MTSSGAPAGPYKLVTVNTAPERAYRLIGRLIEALKDSYTIIHAANCESKRRPRLSVSRTADMSTAIEDVGPTVEQVQPDMLVRPSSEGTPKRLPLMQI